MENNKINKTLLFIKYPLFYVIDRLLSNLNMKISRKIKIAVLIICSLLVFVYALLKIVN